MDIGNDPNSIDQKKSEFSLFFWIGFIIMPVSAYFCYFYFRKDDYLNFDSYSIIADSEQTNTAVNQYSRNYRLSSKKFYVLGSLVTDSITSSYSRIRNYFFTQILHTFLFVKRGSVLSSSKTVYYRSISLTLSDMYFPFDVCVDSKCSYFSVPITKVNTSNINSFISESLNEIHLLYFSHDSIVGIRIDSTTYTSNSQTVTVYIHDSAESLDYYFPALEGNSILSFSFISLFIGLIFVMTFLWHCWSVRFIIIDRVIQQCSPQQRYY